MSVRDAGYEKLKSDSMDDSELKRSAQVQGHLKELLSNRSFQEIVQNGFKELKSAREDRRVGIKASISAQILDFRNAKVKEWEKTSRKLNRAAWLVSARLICCLTCTCIRRTLEAYKKHRLIYEAEIKYLEVMKDRVFVEGLLPLWELDDLTRGVQISLERSVIGIFSEAQKISNNDPNFLKYMLGHLNKRCITVINGIFVDKQFNNDATRGAGFTRIDPAIGLNDQRPIETNTIEGQMKAIYELVCADRTREQLTKEREWEIVMQRVATQTPFNAIYNHLPAQIARQLEELTPGEPSNTYSIVPRGQRELTLAPKRDENRDIERVHVTAILHFDLIKGNNILIGNDIAIFRYQFDVVIPDRHEVVQDLNALSPGRVDIENLTTQMIDNSLEILGFS